MPDRRYIASWEKDRKLPSPMTHYDPTEPVEPQPQGDIIQRLFGNQFQPPDDFGASDAVTPSAPTMPQAGLTKAFGQTQRKMWYDQIHSDKGMDLKTFEGITDKEGLVEPGEKIDIRGAVTQQGVPGETATRYSGEQRVFATGKPTSGYERIEEAAIGVAQAPITVGPVTLSAAEWAVLLGITIETGGAAIASLPLAYTALMRGAITRNINKWSMETNTPVDNTLKKAAIDYYSRMSRPSWANTGKAIKELWKPSATGKFVPTPQATAKAEEYTMGIVKRFMPEFTKSRTDQVIAGIRAGKYQPDAVIPSVQAVQGVEARLGGEVKEPWQMTRDEYSGFASRSKTPERATRVKQWTALQKILQDNAKQGRREGLVTKSQWRTFIDKYGQPDTVSNDMFHYFDDPSGVGIIVKEAVTTEARQHYSAVQQALSEGKPVPAEVLKDYPDLKSTTPEVTPESKIRESIIYPKAEVTPKQSKAMQWVEDEGVVDMSGNPIVVDKDGMVTLYHRTTQAAADQMTKTGRFVSKENTDETFFSNKSTGQAEGYGDVIVTVKVPAQDVRINDAFRDEIHVAVSNKKLSLRNIPATPLPQGKRNLAGVIPTTPTEAPVGEVAPIIFKRGQTFKDSEGVEWRITGKKEVQNVSTFESASGQATFYEIVNAKGEKLNVTQKDVLKDQELAQPTPTAIEKPVAPPEGTLWHGSPSGDLRGGAGGLHIGTREAAKQALEARIGVPAEGEWDGTREYGKTLLAGKNTLAKKDPKGYLVTGYNTDAPKEDYYPTGKAKYGDGSIVSLSSKPNIVPVRITGKMTNTPATAYEDYKAGGYMSAQIKRGTAKSGYYYTNVGEDEGSISAVLPNAQHIEILNRKPTVKENLSVPPEAVSEGIPPSEQVKAIQDKGRVTPTKVKPDDAKYAHVELANPAGIKPPKPPKPPTEAAKPKDPDEVFKMITDKGWDERPDQALLRLHEAARNNLTRETNIIIEEGDKWLKEMGIGVTKRGHLVPREEDKPKLIELYNALHNPSKVESGEIAIPEGFDHIYNHLRSLADWDTASRIDFDPNAATLEDWFFRGWKPPEGMFADTPQRGGLVTQPRALRMPRVGATFNEMIEAGFEPLFWNPYQQWGYRHNLGEVYKEQMELVGQLKAMGNDLIRPDSGGAMPAGWKIPRIGQAFEGKPFAATDADGNPAVMFTRRWIVPTKVANSLENIYGRRPDMGKFVIGKAEIDPLKVIDFFTFGTKRAKLFLSFFQQIDFINRAGGASWAKAVDDLQHGKPLDAIVSVAKYTKTAAEIIQANFSPGKRLSLMKQLSDTTPLIEGRPGVTLNGISKAGLSTMDLTIFAEEMDKLMRIEIGKSGIWGKIKGGADMLVDLESAMRRGLFNGVYPAAMITDIKNNTAITMARAHPAATDNQLNAMIAKEMNKRYSTIPPSQSIFQNSALREILRRVFFSVGESEALLRQASSAFHGSNKAFWIKSAAGVALFVLAVANVIHYASTGEPLPKERYLPIAKDNWGPLPFGYNAQFAAPTLPWKGRGNVELTMDLMGQMDTALRVLDPGSFLTARTSVPVRATMNQVTGTDFYGAPIDDVGPGGLWSRLAQAAVDLYAPIGVGGIATEAIRQNVPGTKDLIPEGESRLGMLGLGLQSTGVNIRAEGTNQLLDKYARESGFLKADRSPVQSWSDLEPYQKDEVGKNPELLNEMAARQETSVERGYPGSLGFKTLADLDKSRIERGEALVTEFDNGEYEAGEFPSEVTKLKTEIAAKKSQVDDDFQLYQDTQELPEDPNKRALVEYYAIFDNAKRQSQVINWDKVEQLEEQLRARWTPEQEAYVDRNIGLTEWGPKMQEYIDAQDTLSESGYWDITEPNQYDKRMALRRKRPEIEAILTKWYGYKPSKGSATPSRSTQPSTSDRTYKASWEK